MIGVLSLLLLLGVGTAGAETLDLTINGTRVIVGTTYCRSPDMGVTCTPGKEVGQWNIEMPCLAKMEGAMKATEPFIGKKVWETDTCLMGGYACDEKQGDTFTPATYLWTDAKRDCWTK